MRWADLPLKLPSSSGPMIQVRTLSQRELIHLENNQTLLSSPPTNAILRVAKLLISAHGRRFLFPRLLRRERRLQAHDRSEAASSAGPLTGVLRPSQMRSAPCR